MSLALLFMKPLPFCHDGCSRALGPMPMGRQPTGRARLSGAGDPPFETVENFNGPRTMALSRPSQRNVLDALDELGSVARVESTEQSRNQFFNSVFGNAELLRERAIRMSTPKAGYELKITPRDTEALMQFAEQFRLAM